MAEYTSNAPERELGWDDTITRDATEFVVLPEGDYAFTVTKFERARHNGSEKLPACNKAILTLEINGNALGSAVITHSLFLHSKCESLLSAFFVSIGLKKKGEPLAMGSYWSQLVGKTGMAKVRIHKWTSDRDGQERSRNEIDRFLEPVTVSAPAKGWTPGSFA